MFSKAFYLFMHPTGPEIVVAIVIGLLMGIATGYLMDINDISSWKELIEFLKKEFKR
jgi:uncharacterized membrane protein (DUF106 family)